MTVIAAVEAVLLEAQHRLTGGVVDLLGWWRVVLASPEQAKLLPVLLVLVLQGVTDTLELQTDGDAVVDDVLPFLALDEAISDVFRVVGQEIEFLLDREVLSPEPLQLCSHGLADLVTLLHLLVEGEHGVSDVVLGLLQQGLDLSLRSQLLPELRSLGISAHGCGDRVRVLGAFAALPKCCQILRLEYVLDFGDLLLEAVDGSLQLNDVLSVLLDLVPEFLNRFLVLWLSIIMRLPLGAPLR